MFIISALMYIAETFGVAGNEMFCTYAMTEDFGLLEVYGLSDGKGARHLRKRELTTRTHPKLTLDS